MNQKKDPDQKKQPGQNKGPQEKAPGVKGPGEKGPESDLPPRTGTPPVVTSRSPLLPFIALLWVLAFTAIFFQFDLPNSSPRVNRTKLLTYVPQVLLDTLDPPRPLSTNYPGPDGRQRYDEAVQRWEKTGWKNLPERIPFVSWGLFLLWTGWSVGQFLLRRLDLPELITTAEHNYLAILTGLGVLSLATLALGIAGVMSRGVFVMGLFTAAIIAHWELYKDFAPHEWTGFNRHALWKWLPLIPFLLLFLLGSLLPEIDFDVKEYHLGGPKEWYLAGRITFLPHNVYTSFPFLTEMLLLLGMIVTGDWYWGALTGKFLLMSLAPLTAWGLYLAGRRWFSPTAGWAAAMLFLTTPWIYRISIIAYAEGGLSAYLFASLFALLLAGSLLKHSETAQETWKLALICGWFAGCAMACKYPGLVSVVIPMGACIAALPWTVAPSLLHQTRWKFCSRLVLLFALGVALGIGPWLFKNAYETDNPVYPLAYNLFGGVDWSPALNAKWKHAHSSPPGSFGVTQFAENVIDVTMKSDWQSPLIFSLAPLAFLLPRRRNLVTWLSVFVFFLFLQWWGLTHRIDRFWIPLLPVATLLAGAGITWSRNLLWTWGMGALCIVVGLYHLAFITTPFCGYNAFLLDLNVARAETRSMTSPEITFLEEHLPPRSNVLFVGEAELFDATFHYAYNTVFDFCLLEQWSKTPDGKLRPYSEIHQELLKRGFTHVCVNWMEILRYREPGSYDYTDFAVPRTFIDFQKQGILGPGLPDTGFQFAESLSATQLKEIETWGPELFYEKTVNGKAFKLMRTYEVFPVLPLPKQDKPPVNTTEKSPGTTR
ncbi:MAG: hypothetical protein U0903_21365 [Planctomycetales bacterium]